MLSKDDQIESTQYNSVEKPYDEDIMEKEINSSGYYQTSKPKRTIIRASVLKNDES